MLLAGTHLLCVVGGRPTLDDVTMEGISAAFGVDVIR
jgi:molybdopterin-biosynthesis enzyme MoeA-like protein